MCAAPVSAFRTVTNTPHLQLCQDQEEERLDFVKAKMWDWANALSAVAMTEDEVRPLSIQPRHSTDDYRLA